MIATAVFWHSEVKRCVLWRLLVACAVALGLLGCTTKVVRISNGSTSVERAISPQAYTAYARARMLERNGDEPGATAGYYQVLALDASADEAWIRLGALGCERNQATAAQAFARAENLRSNNAGLYAARAECAGKHRDFAKAVSAAINAIRLDPNDSELSLLVVRLHAESGNRSEALRYAWAHVAVFPNDTRGWLQLASIVASPPSLVAQIQSRAAQRVPNQYRTMGITRLAPHDAPLRLDRAMKARLDLEHALATGDQHAAQQSARDLGLSIVVLIALADTLGAAQLARDLATLAGQIQPEDPDLWQTRLDLADRLHNDDQFAALLRQIPTPNQSSSSSDAKPQAWGKLRAVVKRRTGIEPD